MDIMKEARECEYRCIEKKFVARLGNGSSDIPAALPLNAKSRLASRHRVTSSESLTKRAKMGIKQLFSIIKDECPDAYKEGEIKNQFGRKVAIVSPSHPNAVINCLTSPFRMRTKPHDIFPHDAH
jgi:hypothetical protein